MTFILNQQEVNENEKVFLVTINTMEGQLCLENQYVVCIGTDPKEDIVNGFSIMINDSNTMILSNEITEKELLKNILRALSTNI